MKIYFTRRSKIVRTCQGCKRQIFKKKPCIYVNRFWSGIDYKAYYHNKRCLEKGIDAPDANAGLHSGH